MRHGWRAGSDIVDEPGPLKVQTDPVPYLGGVAVFVAWRFPSRWHAPVLLLPLGLALALGLADDRNALSPTARVPWSWRSGPWPDGSCPRPGLSAW